MLVASRISPYALLFDHVLYRTDPERAHHLTIRALGLAGLLPGSRAGLRTAFRVPATPVPQASPRAARLLGPMASPFGLAAGFDKSAAVPLQLLDLGFGHVEVGTITARAQDGNPRPRVFRLTEDRALINRMGFNNAGAEGAARRLARVRSTERGQRAVIGVNIGKTKTTPLEEAAQDYRASARALSPYASYLAVNVSSPNTPGLRDLQSTESLRPILLAVLEEAETSRRRLGRTVPVLVKIAPDLHDEDVRAVADLAREIGLAGVIATNTTIARPTSLRTSRQRVEEIGAGGLSGPILSARAAEILALLREALPADALVISAGGITTGADAAERLRAGADLVQGYTGLIYEGPGWPARIHRELLAEAL